MDFANRGQHDALIAELLGGGRLVVDLTAEPLPTIEVFDLQQKRYRPVTVRENHDGYPTTKLKLKVG